jgi:tetrahydromethanopterin S-methyltransferase subunit G
MQALEQIMEHLVKLLNEKGIIGGRRANDPTEDEDIFDFEFDNESSCSECGFNEDDDYEDDDLNMGRRKDDKMDMDDEEPNMGDDNMNMGDEDDLGIDMDDEEPNMGDDSMDMDDEPNDIESRLDDVEDKLNTVLSQFAQVIAKDMSDDMGAEDDLDMDDEEDDDYMGGDDEDDLDATGGMDDEEPGDNNDGMGVGNPEKGMDRPPEDKAGIEREGGRLLMSNARMQRRNPDDDIRSFAKFFNLRRNENRLRK